MSTPYYSKFETDEKLLNVLVGSTPIGNPNIPIPEEVTGNAHVLGVGAGTYTNWGGMVIPENNLGTLRRINGEYFVSLTEIELGGLVQKSEVDTKFSPSELVWTDGFYVNISGISTADSRFSVGTVPVIPNIPIQVKLFGDAGGYSVYFDKNDKKVSHISSASTIDSEYVPPAAASILKVFTLTTEKINSFIYLKSIEPLFSSVIKTNENELAINRVANLTEALATNVLRVLNNTDYAPAADWALYGIFNSNQVIQEGYLKRIELRVNNSGSFKVLLCNKSGSTISNIRESTKTYLALAGNNSIDLEEFLQINEGDCIGIKSSQLNVAYDVHYGDSDSFFALNSSGGLKDTYDEGSFDFNFFVAEKINNKIDFLENEIEKTNEVFVDLKNETLKKEYKSVFVDDFSTQKTEWIRTTNWVFDSPNKRLYPIATGGMNSNNIKLNLPYSADKRICRFKMELQSDTVANIMMQSSDNNTGIGESFYRIDVPNNKLIMYAHNDDTHVNTSIVVAEKVIDFSILDGSKYLIELEKDDYSFYFRIIDYLSAKATELKHVGWEAGRQQHNYSFSLQSGNSFILSDFEVTILNNPSLIFSGDSITEGVTMDSTNSSNPNNLNNRYAELIRKSIGNCIISAKGGNQIDHVINLVNSEYKLINPKYLVVTIGTNGGNTLAKFKDLIDLCDANNIPLIINYTPCGLTDSYNQVRDILTTLIADVDYKDKFIIGCRMDNATAVDYFPIVDSSHPTTISGGVNIRIDLSLMNFSGEHPNYLGSKRMADRFYVDVPFILKV